MTSAVRIIVLELYGPILERFATFEGAKNIQVWNDMSECDLLVELLYSFKA